MKMDSVECDKLRNAINYGSMNVIDLNFLSVTCVSVGLF